MGLLKVNVEGSFRVQMIFQGLNAALDQTEILDQGAAILLARRKRMFLAEQRPDGSPWPKSKAALLRAAKGRGGGTLYDTGRMYRSIQLARSTQSERFIGTDVPYAKYHQLYKISGIRREFLGFSEDDGLVVQRFVIKRIREFVKEFGSGLPG